MARSPEQNRLARERARESLIQAAIDVFADQGIDGATIAEITRRAGVAQGLVSYHFGGKDQLVSAVVDRWFELLFGIAHGEPVVEALAGAPPRPRPAQAPSADMRLAGIIDASLGLTAVALSLRSVILMLQQKPSTRAMFAASERRLLEGATAAEDAVRSVFRERGSADPAMEEIMLRSLLEGIAGQRVVYGDSYPLEEARRWVHRRYGLPEPTTPLPGMPAPLPPDPGAEPRARASR